MDEKAKIRHSKNSADLNLLNSRINSPVIALALVIACIISVIAGVTTAYLITTSGPLENNFTIGEIKLELTETTSSSYKLVPGTTVKKDPTVSVLAGSEACFLFVKITKSNNFDEYISYEIADGWTHLGGYDGIYYRTVDKTDVKENYSILKDNSITVKDNLTEEKMSVISAPPTISFCAYAVQSHNMDGVVDAWLQILAEEARR